MKKFLRMLSIAMALVMCFTMVFTTAVSAEGTTPAITLGDAKTALAGDTITIPVTLEGFAAAGIVGAEFNVDLGGLEYVSNDAIVDGEAVANYADGVVRYADVPGLVTDGEVAPYEDGTLFTITATIPADAETDATYTVTVSDVVAATSAEEKVEVTGGEVVITVGSDVVACEHDWVCTTAVPATAETTGTLNLTCSLCAEETVKTVLYYANYKAAYTHAECAAQTNIVYSARKDRLAEQGDYSDVFIYLQHTLSSTGENKVTVINVSEATDTQQGSSNRPCKSWNYGIRSTQMTETVNSNVFVCVNDQWYNGQLVGYSIRSYIDQRLTSTTDPEEKQVYVNMLDYGAKMQIAKNYNTENLATDGLSESDLALIPTELPEITATKTDNHDNTSVYINKFVIDLASKVEAVMYFRSDRYTGTNKDDYKVVASWSNANGVAKEVTIRKEGSAETADLYYTSELMADGSVRENRYTFSFAELNSYDLRQPVTFYIYDGENEVSKGYTASIEALIKEGIASGTYGAALDSACYALMHYSDAAYQYFCVQ